jgi:hypothetical protein
VVSPQNPFKSKESLLDQQQGNIPYKNQDVGFKKEVFVGHATIFLD